MTSIEWADPPPQRTGVGNSKWLSVVAALKGRPGQWAKIATFGSPSSAQNLSREIRRGAGHWAPAGAFDAVRRDLDVYARYLGEEGRS